MSSRWWRLPIRWWRLSFVKEVMEVVKQVVEAVKEVQQELSGNGCSSHPPCALTLNYPLFIH